MLRPLIRRPGKLAQHSTERGFSMALVALAIAAIVSMAALSIDIGTLYQAKAEAQRSADSAALTAAKVISLSGITGDPNDSGLSWTPACGGGSSAATEAAVSMAQQNLIGGVAVPTASVTVKYSAGSAGTPNASCVGIANFAVNPVVTVNVKRTGLPVFFARIFSLFGGSYSGSSVSATATAEAFNPSSSSPMVPVNPRCVKPWVVPNADPGHAGATFVSAATGQITPNPGISPAGVVGETFNLLTDCGSASSTSCVLTETPAANSGASTLDYVPGPVSNSTAVSANSSVPACLQSHSNNFTEAVAGCDQSALFACGKALQYTVDLSVNPGNPNYDSVNGAECLINASAAGLDNGQDYLSPDAPPYTYPFQIRAGTGSALLTTGITSGSQISTSPSIVSLPIYDNTATVLTTGSTGTPAVTVVGFLQVFINQVDATGRINVTVMNVAGCGNSATSPAVKGTSPVPVRLITPP